MVQGYANDLIQDITAKWPALAARTGELASVPPDGSGRDGEELFNDLTTKWNYYKALPPSTWVMSLTWSWQPCGGGIPRRDGSCDLTPPNSTESSASVSSSRTPHRRLRHLSLPQRPQRHQSHPPARAAPLAPGSSRRHLVTNVFAVVRDAAKASLPPSDHHQLLHHVHSILHVLDTLCYQPLLPKFCRHQLQGSVRVQRRPNLPTLHRRRLSACLPLDLARYRIHTRIRGEGAVLRALHHRRPLWRRAGLHHNL